MRRRTGVVCPVCGAKLVIVQARVIWMGIALLLAGIISAVCVAVRTESYIHRSLTQGELAAVILSVGALFTIAHFRVSPCFARLRAASKQEDVDYPLSRQAGI